MRSSEASRRPSCREIYWEIGGAGGPAGATGGNGGADAVTAGGAAGAAEVQARLPAPTGLRPVLASCWRSWPRPVALA